MKIQRHKIEPRPHVLVELLDGFGDQWVGPHLGDAVVKFEIVAEGEVDTAALKAKALAAGAVHVHPIVVRRPAVAPEAIVAQETPLDPAEGLLAYAAHDRPPAGVEPPGLLKEIL